MFSWSTLKSMCRTPKPRATQPIILRVWDDGGGTRRVADVAASNCRQYAAGRSDAAARRDLEVLRAALSYWHKHRGPLATLPAVILPKRAPARDTWLSRNDAARLLWGARRSQHLRRFILIGLYTGTRSGNILRLQWDQIDLVSGVMARLARWRGRGCSQASAKGQARKTDFIAPAPLASPRRRDNQVSVPLRWASGDKAAPIIPGRGEESWPIRGNAAHSSPHQGDVAHAGRRSYLGSRWSARHDNRNARADLRPPPSRLAKACRGGVNSCAVSVPLTLKTGRSGRI